MELIESIEKISEKIKRHKQISFECDINNSLIKLFDNLLESLQKLSKSIESTGNIRSNYINQFESQINSMNSIFDFVGEKNYYEKDPESIRMFQLNYKSKIEIQEIAIKQLYDQFDFISSFFDKLGFFKDNIVVIGANGSGKTSLSNYLKQYFNDNFVVISAQKILIIPTFSYISNIQNTENKLKNIQNADKTLKTTYTTENNGNAYGLLVGIGEEFKILLDNLLADRNKKRNEFCDNLNEGNKNNRVPETNLDKVIKIWNSLITHRKLECNDGISFTVNTKEMISYPAYGMSEGEKVILFHVAQVLQAPESSFIIIDEPEMYLHKTITKKLWDKLEQERPDCIFIYLTHDLDFASTRTNAKKIWIKSFTNPDKWDFENIPENELPEPLLLELIGSRKNILFCEGEKGSLDEQIFNILLPEFTITPLESCFNVINYTKAFNKIPNITTKAYGLIDSDYLQQERKQSLKEENIYTYSVAEIENLFLDEKFLSVAKEKFSVVDPDAINNIKECTIKELKNNIDLQISNYLSSKINYYFKDSHMHKGNNIDEVENNLDSFINKIDIKNWYEERKNELEEDIKNKSYSNIILKYNNKGLKAIVNKHFNINDFIPRAIKLIKTDTSTHTILLNHFPNELKNQNK